jgi:cytochrome c oxidase cbb3-type subunit 4
MDYATLAHFAQTVGLLYFIAIFAGVLVYALRPKAKAEFERHARIPLSED